MELDKKFPPVLACDTVATFIPSRSPAFKVHSKPGLAHNALGQRGYNEAKAKYELENGVWVRTYAYVPPKVCKNCNGSFGGGYYRYYDDPRQEDLRLWERTPVCKNCVSVIKQEMEQEELDTEYRANHERYFLNK